MAADSPPITPSHPAAFPSGVLTVRRRAAAGNYAELILESERSDQNSPQCSAEHNRSGEAGRIRTKIQETWKRVQKSASKLKKSIPEPIKSYFVPPKKGDEWLQFLFIRLPILNWVWSYKPKQIAGDLLAGIVVGFAHITESECAPYLHAVLVETLVSLSQLQPLCCSLKHVRL